ncbi:MAG: AAA family ATPase [Spirosomaceae bacterium]|jgi:predicted ATP-binding protein involved in virulence|nr:AAA family ATPase [Spirosomataceae bacterium]
MRITRLEAQNIGPFEDLKIDFEEKVIKDKAEIHILTGENGTGKSTVLMLLASWVDDTNQTNIGSRLRLSKETKEVMVTDFEKFLEGFKSSHKISFDSADESKLYQLIKNGKKLNNLYRFYPKEFDLCPFFGYSGYRLTKGDGIVNIREITSEPLENAVNFEKNIDSSLILDWVANVVTKELLAKSKGVESNDVNAVQKIEKALSDITNKKIEFDLEDTLKVSVKVNGVSLSFNTLPDGLKSIISWLSDLLMRLDRINWADKSKSILEQNFILFLDEIEVHLHPSWQRKILPVVQDLFPNAQIFISTHSPFVVGSVDGARVYKFKLDENNNSVLEKTYLSEDGHSYQYYLRTGFDIDSDFGIENEKDLNRFMELKEKIIKGEDVDMGEFDEIMNRLENQTGELSSIVGFEKRKLEKYLNKNLTTA